MIMEETIFKGTPSQVSNIGYYILCVCLTPFFGLGLFMALFRYLNTKNTKIQITNERIIQKTGFLSIKTDEAELYRIKDIRLEEPLFLRLLGLSNIILVTNDETSPYIFLKGLNNGYELRNNIREVVEVRREVKGVNK